MKFNFLCVFAVFFISMYPLSADNSVKSRLDEDGGFYNRIRIENDFFRISLNSLFLGEKFAWIEPAFKSEQLVLGRLNLKGIIRESFNPDSITPESGVLHERAGITVTDSFSRSSRYGGALKPWSSPDLLLWYFLNNTGLFNAGILLYELAPVERLLPSWLKIETDFMLNTGVTEHAAAGSWFSDKPLIPEQLIFTPGAEIRLLAGETELQGRKVMQLRSEQFTAAASVLCLYTIPQYTESGGLCRVYIVMGNRALNLNGLFQTAEPGYIYPGGKQASNQLTAGAGLGLLTVIGCSEIETSCSYNYKLKNAEIIPSRSLRQTEIWEIDVDVTFSELINSSVNWEFKREFDKNGIEQRSSSAGFELSLSGLPVSLGFEFGGDINFSETALLFADKSYSIEAGLELENIDFLSSLSVSEDEVLIKNRLELSLDAVRFKASGTFGAAGITELNLEVTSM